MTSVDASLTRYFSNFVLHPDQRAFSRDASSLQMTAFSRFDSNTNLNRIDEIRGNFIVEADDLPVSERNFDRKTHTYHTNHFIHPKNQFESKLGRVCGKGKSSEIGC